jgi:transposase
MEGKSMSRLLLTDEEWELIEDLFPEPKATGRPPANPRTILDGILWILRTGSQWRDLPAEFGAFQTVWRYFDHWNANGTLNGILQRLQGKAFASGMLDKQLWCFDGTVVRAHRCAAGGGKKATRKNLLTMH